MILDRYNCLGIGMGMGMGMGLQLKVLDVAAGCDVIAAVYDFTNHHQLEGVSVISAHGIVRDVTVYQPNTPPFFTCNSVYKLL
ncbi:putative PPC domain-containing protein [Helianthus annuus]|nr:putative PPC domain-containing protein [Helianthus annuus]